MEEIKLGYEGNNYDPKKDKDSSITCKFKLKLELPEVKEDILKTIEFVNKRFQSSSHLKMNNNENEFELIVNGRHKDGRCTQCRSFRTCLRSLLLKKGLKLKPTGFCKFDKENKYGIYLIEDLENNIRAYEKGVHVQQNEISEKEYEGWKEKLAELNKMEEEAYRIVLNFRKEGEDE